MSTFKATASVNFREQMILRWIEDEKFSRYQALECYACEEFEELVRRMETGDVFEFNMDTADTCFESIDNNYVIPISILNRGVDMKIARLEARIADLESALQVSHFQVSALKVHLDRGAVDRYETCKLMNNDHPHPLLINAPARKS